MKFEKFTRPFNSSEANNFKNMSYMTTKKFSNCRKYLILLLIPFVCLFSQQIDDSGEKFIRALISGEENIVDYIDQDELKISKRLGIEYENLPNKYLLTYDIDESVKAKINSGQLTYTLEPIALEDDFSMINFRIAEQNYSKTFYFKDEKFISPIRYFSRNWISQESKYFHFIASDPTLFNSYSIAQMDMFFESMANILNLSNKEKRIVKKEKIYYYLCKDQNEIQDLTGYNARGLYVVAHDYLVSTFNTHTHEAAHLLINFKLGTVPLYTHPFLQEGFAVANGGRGGKDKNVILNLGEFLCQSSFLTPDAILDGNEFYQNSASMTYPVSGLYNKFLLQALGSKKYLNLYLKYSSSNPGIRKSVIDKRDLPSNSDWEQYLEHPTLSSIEFETSQDTHLIYDKGLFQIYQDSDYYYFKAKDTLLIGSNDHKTSYHSKLFKQFFPKQTYNGEKYLIIVNEQEISIYNLFTNNLVDKYTSSFTLSGQTVPYEDGKYVFRVEKGVLDGDILGESK